MGKPQKKLLKLVKERVTPSLTSSRYLALRFLSSHIKEIAESSSNNRANLKILDVGCGIKPYSMYFKSREELYVGTDKRVTSNFKVVDVKAMAEMLPFNENSFDIVLCTQVLEHSLSPKKTLQEIYLVLKKDGLLILSTHGTWIEGHETPDLWRWTISGMKKVLSCTGFIILKSYSMNPFETLIQICLFYIPETKISKYVVYPCFNAVAKMLSNIFPKKAPNFSAIHIVSAAKK
jgi:ubiquinone/menaquinone biosynthesis C-methylase UbiE